jgi:hypothetical protein
MNSNGTEYEYGGVTMLHEGGFASDVLNGDRIESDDLLASVFHRRMRSTGGSCVCTTGYANPLKLCMECDAGYVWNSDGVCSPCPTDPRTFVESESFWILCLAISVVVMFTATIVDRGSMLGEGLWFSVQAFQGLALVTAFFLPGLDSGSDKVLLIALKTIFLFSYDSTSFQCDAGRGKLHMSGISEPADLLVSGALPYFFLVFVAVLGRGGQLLQMLRRRNVPESRARKNAGSAHGMPKGTVSPTAVRASGSVLWSGRTSPLAVGGGDGGGGGAGNFSEPLLADPAEPETDADDPRPSRAAHFQQPQRWRYGSDNSGTGRETRRGGGNAGLVSWDAVKLPRNVRWTELLGTVLFNSSVSVFGITSTPMLYWAASGLVCVDGRGDLPCRGLMPRALGYPSRSCVDGEMTAVSLFILAMFAMVPCALYWIAKKWPPLLRSPPAWFRATGVGLTRDKLLRPFSPSGVWLIPALAAAKAAMAASLFVGSSTSLFVTRPPGMEPYRACPRDQGGSVWSLARDVDWIIRVYPILVGCLCLLSIAVILWGIPSRAIFAGTRFSFALVFVPALCAALAMALGLGTHMWPILTMSCMAAGAPIAVSLARHILKSGEEEQARRRRVNPLPFDLPESIMGILTTPAAADAQLLGHRGGDNKDRRGGQRETPVHAESSHGSDGDDTSGTGGDSRDGQDGRNRSAPARPDSPFSSSAFGSDGEAGPASRQESERVASAMPTSRRVLRVADVFPDDLRQLDAEARALYRTISAEFSAGLAGTGVYASQARIARIRFVHNEGLLDAFVGRMELLASDHGLARPWPEEAPQLTSRRDELAAMLHTKVSRIPALPHCTHPRSGRQRGQAPSNCRLDLVWHGVGAENAATRIAEFGFKKLQKLNAGWFGAGVYLTSFSGYALYYATYGFAPRGEVRGTDPAPASGDHVILLSWALLGRSFPVLERLDDDAPELSPLHKFHSGYPGHDSHYAVVKWGGEPVDVTALAPDAALSEVAMFDEIVISQESQLLPFAIVYVGGVDLPVSQSGSPVPKPPQQSSRQDERLELHRMQLAGPIKRIQELRGLGS